MYLIVNARHTGLGKAMTSRGGPEEKPSNVLVDRLGQSHVATTLFLSLESGKSRELDGITTSHVPP